MLSRISVVACAPWCSHPLVLLPQVGIYKALLDTASGLDYLHSIGVVHGDLKTANVLLKGGKEQRGVSCKITDFGLSRVLDMNASHVSTGTHGEHRCMQEACCRNSSCNPAATHH